MSRFKNSKIYPVIFLTVTVLISVALLLGINSVTEKRVVEQQEKEIKAMLSEMFPELDEFEMNDDIYSVYTGNEVTGYAFLATGKGYGGDIDILIGIDPEYYIKDIKIVSNVETPGLGSRITESSFTDQFKGLESSEVTLSKDGGSVDAITGATISSSAVVDAIKDELDVKIKILKDN